MRIRRVLALCLALILCLSLMIPAGAASVSDALQDTANYLQITTPNP